MKYTARAGWGGAEQSRVSGGGQVGFCVQEPSLYSKAWRIAERERPDVRQGLRWAGARVTSMYTIHTPDDAFIDTVSGAWGCGGRPCIAHASHDDKMMKMKKKKKKMMMMMMRWLMVKKEKMTATKTTPHAQQLQQQHLVHRERNIAIVIIHAAVSHEVTVDRALFWGIGLVNDDVVCALESGEGLLGGAAASPLHHILPGVGLGQRAIGVLLPLGAGLKGSLYVCPSAAGLHQAATGMQQLIIRK